MDYTFIGNRITELLMERNLSEYKLSTGIGRCCSYIQKITSNKCLPSVNGLYAICDYLEITPAEFFTDPSLYNKDIPPELREIMAEMNEEDMEKLIDYARLLTKAKKK